MFSRSVKLSLAIMFLIVGTALCYDDDEDDVLTEVVIDMIAGYTIEECSYNKACSEMMSIISVSTIVAALVMWCIYEDCRCRMPTCYEARRTGSVYAGMRLRRAFHH